MDTETFTSAELHQGRSKEERRGGDLTSITAKLLLVAPPRLSDEASLHGSAQGPARGKEEWRNGKRRMGVTLLFSTAKDAERGERENTPSVLHLTLMSSLLFTRSV